MNWNNLSKKELINTICELIKVAEENKRLAEEATRQAVEWKTLYDQYLILNSDPEVDTVH